MRHKSSETSCVRYRDRFATCTPSNGRPSSREGSTWRSVSNKSHGDEKKDERVAPLVLFNIRDDIWTQSGMGLTGCRSAWARFYDDFVFLRDASANFEAVCVTSRCLWVKVRQNYCVELTSNRTRKERFC